jgi:opacity protein-like surface antigen
LAGQLRGIAQDVLWEKGALQFGGFVTTFNSDLTFGPVGAGNSKINAEDLLGLDTHLTVFRVDAMIRPGATRRNQIDAGYAGYHRSGNATLSRDLTLEGTTYPIGAKVDTTFNFDLIRATYTYAFVQTDRVRIGLGLGHYGIPLKYDVNVQTSRGRSTADGADTILPFPALAFRGEFQVLPKLYLKASADGMYLPVSSFSGSLVDANIGLEYRIWKYFGLGLGYNYTEANVEGKSSSSSYPGVDFVGEVSVRFSGLLFYGKVAF